MTGDQYTRRDPRTQYPQGQPAQSQEHPGEEGRMDPRPDCGETTYRGCGRLGSQTPLGRAGQPAELAPAYVFLASQESSYVTGERIAVTGGMPTP